MLSQVRKTAAAILKMISKWIETEQAKGSQSMYIAELRGTFEAILSDGGVPLRRRDGSRRDSLADPTDTGKPTLSVHESDPSI